MRLFVLTLYTIYWTALSVGLAYTGYPTAGALIGATGFVIMYRAWEAFIQNHEVEERVFETIIGAKEAELDVTEGLSDDELEDLAYLFLHDIEEFELEYRALVHAAVLKRDAGEWDGDAWYDDMLDEFGVDDDIEYRGNDL